MRPPITMTADEWRAEGKRRFGDDALKWRFVCPSCTHVASAEDYRKAGAPSTAVGFSCIGRWLETQVEAFDGAGGPCNYAGGGLIRINPVLVRDGENEHQLFAFAEPETPKKASSA